MKFSASLQFTRSWTVRRTPWTGDQLVARPLPSHKHRKSHTYTQTPNVHVLSGIWTHDPGFRASEDSAWRSAIVTGKCYILLCRYGQNGLVCVKNSSRRCSQLARPFIRLYFHINSIVIANKQKYAFYGNDNPWAANIWIHCFHLLYLQVDMRKS
jgi:hypothetical protein